MVVDFPEQLEQRRPTIPLDDISILMSRMAQLLLYLWDRCSILTMELLILKTIYYII